MLFLDVCEQNGQGVDIVHRDIEETLNLFGVKIHGQHAVDAGGDEHVGHQFGGNRHPRGARTTILASIAKIRDGGSDSTG